MGFVFLFFYIKMQVLRDVLKMTKYKYTYTDLSYSLKYTSTIHKQNYEKYSS